MGDNGQGLAAMARPIQVQEVPIIQKDPFPAVGDIMHPAEEAGDNGLQMTVK
jgi:hypothetical protein